MLTQPSHKDTYLQWNCKFLNGIVKFRNSSNSRRERLFAVFSFFYLIRARGCRKPWCKNRGRGIKGRCPSKIFLFPFKKHAVLNGQIAHTKGCLENRCAVMGNLAVISRFHHFQINEKDEKVSLFSFFKTLFYTKLPFPLPW